MLIEDVTVRSVDDLEAESGHFGRCHLRVLLGNNMDGYIWNIYNIMTICTNFINSHEFIYSHREVSNRNSCRILIYCHAMKHISSDHFHGSKPFFVYK